MVTEIVRNASTFMEHGGLLQHSEEPATGSCCEPCDYSLNSCTPFFFKIQPVPVSVKCFLPLELCTYVSFLPLVLYGSPILISIISSPKCLVNATN